MMNPRTPVLVAALIVTALAVAVPVAAESPDCVGSDGYTGENQFGAGLYQENSYTGVYAYNNSTGSLGFGIWVGASTACVDTTA
jgi:hypothetical protein